MNKIWIDFVLKNQQHLKDGEKCVETKFCENMVYL